MEGSDLGEVAETCFKDELVSISGVHCGKDATGIPQECAGELNADGEESKMSVEMDHETGLGAEIYCASLFAKCDPSNVGRVKVSRVIKTLEDLQGFATNIDEADKTCGDELLREIKQMLDPFDEDPDISLQHFTEEITSYLEKERNRLATGPGAITPCSNLHRRNAARTRSESSSIENHPTQDDFDVVDCETAKFNEFKVKISDLQLQVQKLSEDNLNLRSNLNATQEENFSLHQVQKEEQEKHEIELRSFSEKVKRFERSLADKESCISNLEDTNAQLSARITELGSEFTNLQKETRVADVENADLKSEIKKMLSLLASRDEMIIILKTEQDTSEKEWHRKEKYLLEKNERLSCINKELEEKLSFLKNEKSELETKIHALKTDIDELKVKEKQTFDLNAIENAEIDQCFELDTTTTSNDIETEIMMAAGENLETHFPGLRKGIQPLRNTLKFDVAVQYDYEKDQIQVDNTSKISFRRTAASKLLIMFSFSSLFLLAVFGFSAPLRTTLCSGCLPNSYFKSLDNFFSVCGDLSHDYVPII